MTAALLTGLFGLLGVLTGAVLTPWMTRRADERRDLRSAREAWLLLQADASGALSVVEDRLQKGTWPIVSHQDWSSTWRASRGSLVRYVDEQDFRSVAQAFVRMDALESAVNTPRHPDKRALSEKDREFLAEMSRLLADTIVVLKKPVSRKPPFAS
jgi:hypothetical protein